MINGRKIFRHLKFLIYLFCLLFNFFPRIIKDLAWSAVTIFAGSLPLLIRYAYLKSLAKFVDVNIYVGRFVIIKSIENASFGSNLSIHDFCYIDAAGGIEIGSNVSIAHQCSFITFNHTWSDQAKPIKYNHVKKGKIIIEDDVWIGCGVRVMPGVRIGKRSVIAAGSVVTSDVPAGVVMGGVPARFLKKTV